MFDTVTKQLKGFIYYYFFDNTGLNMEVTDQLIKQIFSQCKQNKV